MAQLAEAEAVDLAKGAAVSELFSHDERAREGYRHAAALATGLTALFVAMGGTAGDPKGVWVGNAARAMDAVSLLHDRLAACEMRLRAGG